MLPAGDAAGLPFWFAPTSPFPLALRTESLWHCADGPPTYLPLLI